MYNNSVVEKKNGMAYVFTLLMFRKPNKLTINKIYTLVLLLSIGIQILQIPICQKNSHVS